MFPRALVMLILLSALSPVALHAAGVGSVAPEIKLQEVWNTPGGAESSLASFRGRVVLLEAFATW